ncbi:MAG: three-Cys-motif partner protein TcmP [Chloroflexi bacterium]|nr:three-Cys-motif partner protein TcmP [Chloroflexota bacterium]MCY3939261.1 three-Cys-motif partner protein TcmP [Chloroflexota bacterium]
MISYGGPWTEEKLRIIYNYLNTYTTVLKDRPFRLIYVDAFAGDGTWQPGSGYAPEDYREFTEILNGSAARALEVQDRPFDRLVFIEKSEERSEILRRLVARHPDRSIEVVTDDANLALPKFCASMGTFDRAVVFLDPYATEVDWETVEAIAGTQKIDCWILFPLMAITRMMPTENVPSDSLATHLDRVFGGNEHWRDFYQESSQLSLFGDAPRHERPPGSALIAGLYRKRLESVFTSVAPTPRTFRNSMNSPMFELFFGAANPVGAKLAVPIADHILKHL